MSRQICNAILSEISKNQPSKKFSSRDRFRSIPLTSAINALEIVGISIVEGCCSVWRTRRGGEGGERRSRLNSVRFSRLSCHPVGEERRSLSLSLSLFVLRALSADLRPLFPSPARFSFVLVIVRVIRQGGRQLYRRPWAVFTADNREEIAPSSPPSQNRPWRRDESRGPLHPLFRYTLSFYLPLASHTPRQTIPLSSSPLLLNHRRQYQPWLRENLLANVTACARESSGSSSFRFFVSGVSQPGKKDLRLCSSRFADKITKIVASWCFDRRNCNCDCDLEIIVPISMSRSNCQFRRTCVFFFESCSVFFSRWFSSIFNCTVKVVRSGRFKQGSPVNKSNFP